MAKASRDGTVLAESDSTIKVEGNHYFPPDDVDWSALEKSTQVTVCPWKGRATYYNVKLPDGTVVKNAGWSYHDPNPAASPIKDHVAFYKRFAIFGKVNIEG